MTGQRTAVLLMVIAIGGTLFLPALAHGQDSTWTAPRTADGRPDLQGIWANNSATPLQRPE